METVERLIRVERLGRKEQMGRRRNGEHGDE